jgi:hypothetical protein
MAQQILDQSIYTYHDYLTWPEDHLYRHKG